MGKIRLIGWIISFLLCSAGSHAMPAAHYAEDHLYCSDACCYVSVKQDKATIVFTRHTPQKEYIKIRFKGGESPGYLPAVPFICRNVFYTPAVTFERANSSFFSEPHKSSSLRGPPDVVLS